MLDYHDQVDESYPRGQSSLEPHNQRARQPISNQMDREGAYFREPDLGRRTEEQRSQSGTPNIFECGFIAEVFIFSESYEAQSS